MLLGFAVDSASCLELHLGPTTVINARVPITINDYTFTQWEGGFIANALSQENKKGEEGTFVQPKPAAAECCWVWCCAGLGLYGPCVSLPAQFILGPVSGSSPQGHCCCVRCILFARNQKVHTAFSVFLLFF